MRDMRRRGEMRDMRPGANLIYPARQTDGTRIVGIFGRDVSQLDFLHRADLFFHRCEKPAQFQKLFQPPLLKVF